MKTSILHLALPFFSATSLAAEDKPIALSHPTVLRMFADYHAAHALDKYQAVFPKLLKLQKRHRAIFDKVGIGESILDYPGLLAMGPLKHFEKSEMGEAHYQLTIGVRPKSADDNQRGLTALDIRFDESGIVTKKTVPRYKW